VSIGVSVGLNIRFALRLQAYAKTSSIPVQFQRRMIMQAIETENRLNLSIFAYTKCNP